MRLDRLEISGFKSFPDRADLAFDAGVTAIVGPNGCGKSNVVDAITWVLGEQSAKSLRGERMEDVIFSGSDARKATAAAEVRLRLSGVATEAARQAAERRDGAGGVVAIEIAPDAPEPRQIDLPAVDTREVEIARRLYRSGESEYLIDGEVCRLREIQDLLMDAGVGVKAYAVIEQGKIGQILSAKPTERRQLIEEAAGVTKYKSRRRAAELKLEAAQQNLTRIEDIVFEIEKQRATLKRQAAKARRYRRLREELRRWEKVAFARRFRVLAQQIEAARAQLTDARGREGIAAGRVAEIERQLADARAALAATEERLRIEREQTHHRQLENERREQQLVFNRQQVEALAITDVELAGEIEALEARREPARLELERRREAAGRADEECSGAAARLHADEDLAREALEALEASEQEVDDARGQVFANQNAVTTLEHAIERAQDVRNRAADALARLEAESADLRVELEHRGVERDEALGRLRAVTAAIDTSRVARAGHEAALEAARAQRHANMEELRARERDLAALTARLESLESLVAHREGYGDAARLLLSDPASGLAHHGSVADYLEAEPRHERAVEALLGDLLQCVIVGRHDDAQVGLALVRDRNAGRVGFLVLEGQPSRERSASLWPGVTPLRESVRVAGPHREAILAALGGHWLADSPETAQSASASLAGSVATAAGDVYRGGQLVFGGARSEAQGILTTKREIRELGARLGHERAGVEALARQLDALDVRLRDTDARLQSASIDLHDHDKAAVTLQLQEDRARTEIDRLSRKLDQIAHERRQASEELRAADTREEDARASIARLLDERQQWQGAFAEAQRRLQEARERAAVAAGRAAESKASHAALVERAAAVAGDVRRLEDASGELAHRLAQRVEERRRASDRANHLQAAIADLERQRVDDTAAIAALRETVAAIERDSAALQEQTEGHEATARDARLLLEEVRADLARLDIARATCESDLNHLAETCADTLQASLEEVAAEVEALEAEGAATPDASAIYLEEDIESEDVVEPLAGDEEPVRHPRVPPELAAKALTAEEAIAELKAKIDRLGPVNMMAIEQFDELEQRHTFLVTQRQDLIDSIATAGEAIKRIDRTTRERFREAFTAINRYFEETFTTLFGGGRAGLVLLDESDLLESGIDIIAQPPGKRLQSVQLLSGGEKALTAMALMFGIFKYRPSPFCLLDEIDAPLDDANIGRFIEMLRGMQDNTQFILVTHHRKTMEIADRLYGVTMEEPGVSKLISLKLN